MGREVEVLFIFLLLEAKSQKKLLNPQMGRGQGHVTYFLNFGTAFNNF